MNIPQELYGLLALVLVVALIIAAVTWWGKSKPQAQSIPPLADASGDSVERERQARNKYALARDARKEVEVALMSKTHQKRAIIWWTLVLTIPLIVFSFASLLLGDIATEPMFGYQFTLHSSTLVIAFFIVYVPLSYYEVPEGTVGALVFLGMPIRHLTSGPTLVPLGICKVVLFSSEDFQDELPAEPNKIFRNEDKEQIPEGFYPPNRVTFAEKPGSEDPLEKRITAEVSMIIAYHFRWDTVRVITTLGKDQYSARANLKKQINDSAVSTLANHFAGMTAKEAVERKGEASDVVEEMADIIARYWGVDVARVEVKLIGFSHKLNKAMGRVPIAQFNVKTAELEGLALKKRATESNLTPKETRELDVAMEAAKNNRNINIGGILEAVKAFSKSS